MRNAVAWGVVNLFLTMLAGVFENWWIDGIAYLRVVFTFLFWDAISRALHSLPATTSVLPTREARWTSYLIRLLAAADLCYSAIRFWGYWQSGMMPMRPKILELPLLCTTFWILLFVVRQLWWVEKVAGEGFAMTLRRALFYPRRDEGRFYRWFLLVILLLLAVNVILANLSQMQLPIHLLIIADLAMTSAIMAGQFAYLGYPRAPSGLEMRVVGAGLMIFLALISVLGWLITFAFLRMQAAEVAPTMIFSTQMQSDFVVQPQYRSIATQLSNFLQPLFWFEVIGSFCFITLFTFYYRRTLHGHLQQIINGFRQVEKGKLAYRIQPAAWRDEFSQIAESFNQMAQSLEDSYRELQLYQQQLEEQVAQRTAELATEIEQRKNLEVRQGIQEERERIARETHDGLLQTLMALRMHLNRGKRLSQREPLVIQQEMQEMAEEVTQSIQDLRDLINDLNSKLKQKGIKAMIEEYISRQQKSYPVIIHSQWDYQTGLLSEQQELNLLRILQELLTNALRHSKADNIWLEVTLQPDQERQTTLHARVCDNGSGFDPATVAGTGWGLKNIHWRAQQLGAKFQVESKLQQGTSISLAIPIPTQHNHHRPEYIAR